MRALKSPLRFFPPRGALWQLAIRMGLKGTAQNATMTGSNSTPTINDAVRLTTRTIERRTSSFRNLVIAVVAVTFISAVWAGAQLSWRPLLACLALFILLYGVFLYRDSHFVAQWQQQILGMWIQQHLDLKIFAEAMNTLPTLPSYTLQGMLRTLPTKELAPSVDTTGLATRKALAMTLQTINRCQNDRTVSYTSAYTLGLASIALGAIQWSWLPLMGLLSVLPAVGGSKRLISARLRRWKRQILDMYRQQGLELNGFVQIAAQLDWAAIPEAKRDALLACLSRAHSEEQEK
jgi:hypothetical protein